MRKSLPILGVMPVILLVFCVLITTYLGSAPCYATSDTPKESSYVYGDLDGDLEVNAIDLLLLKRRILGHITQFNVPDVYADLDGNGSIDSIDAILMKKYILGFIPSLPNYPTDAGFLRTEGQLLIDENGDPFILKGMAFGNCVWDNPRIPALTHHNESSYAELSDLGFNSVRFYLNYALFEDDTNPYVYKESGFDWLDTNIEWAKKYGIKLVLNMHYPQGGYQSQGNGMDLWLVEENQNRLAALWTEIARRYVNEPTILGYGLVNEPIVPLIGTIEESFDQWKDLAQRLTDEIRAVNENHLIFVERLCAIKDIRTGNSDWGIFNDDANYFLVDGENVVYEFHNYDPYQFTHQGESWAGTADIVKVYPNEDEILAVNGQWAAGALNGRPADLTETDWQYLESSKFTVTEESGLEVCAAVFQAQDLGTGTAYMDDFILKEIDPQGNEKIIYSDGFDNNLGGYYYWSSNGSGAGFWTANVGRNDLGALCIAGTTNDANLSKTYFKAKVGYTYQASAWVKLINCGPSAYVRPRVDFHTADAVYTMNRDYLEACIKSYLQFGIKNNVPLYCGEFGTDVNSFKENRGGENWVTDYIEICSKYDVSWNYHTYHEGAFGLYTNDPKQNPANRNDALYDIFKILLSDES